MLSTGDVHGCLRKLETLLRVIKYPGYVDYNGLSKGDPSAFLPIVSFTLTSFSPPFAEQLMAAGLELTGKTDLRFTDALYKVLRDIFHYKPILTKQQFLQWGFSQRKISVICDIINLVLQRHKQLKKPMVTSLASHKDNGGEAPLALTDADILSGVEGRLSALEDRIENLLSGLDRLKILEKRLEELERWRNTDKTPFQDEGEVITISKESWENLMSRVLLLETKLELSNTKMNAPPPCHPPSSSSTTSCSSISTSVASKEDIKDRLESITNIAERSRKTNIIWKSMEEIQPPLNGHLNGSVTRKRDDYLEWPDYFMAVAFLSAQRSKDPSSQVGACIVNQENKIVGIGYNGMPNGCNDDLLPWSRSAEDRLDTKYPYVCHAELNAIMNKNSADVKGCTMYVALFPCNECAKLIIQAGLKEVVFLSDKYHDTPEMTASRRLLSMAGIQFRQFKPKKAEIVIDFNSMNHPGMLNSATK
ncbi:hypothetical protein INR49_022647 [Caranx melampygus]|nr:hypothetical protein INR49_022647 [Caranx melampygus]